MKEPSHEKPSGRKGRQKIAVAAGGKSLENSRLVVTIAGEQLVSGSIKLRTLLLEALDRADWVEVNCHGLTDADLTLFQLLCAANHTASGRNKIFTLTGQKEAPFIALTTRMGLVRHESGSKNICQNCIWTGGEQ